MLKIALRITDASNGMVVPALEMIGSSLFFGVEQIVEPVARQAHRVLTRRNGAAVKLKFA